MVQPETASLLADSGPERRSSSSSSSEGESEQRPVEETYSTTDDCMSSQDGDGEFHSLRSREDSEETQLTPALDGKESGQEVDVRANPSFLDAAARSAAYASASPSAGEESLTEQISMGQKRQIGQDDGPPQGPLRKACDLCTKRKRKCNGKHPCSQCIETGAKDHCVYSPRLKSGRKKKVRVNGLLFDEGNFYSGGVPPEFALVPNPAGRGSAPSAAGYTINGAAGRFSASGAVGFAGHMENFFLATYLRDFNRMVPLTSESSVTEGMLEVLSPAVSSQGLAAASPIKQPESRRQAKLAVFWGVVAMGSRILGASDDATAKYLALMRTSLRECFDCNDKEVVQAYLLLSTVETMRGNEEAGKRYLDHAHTMHNGNAMGPDGKLIKNRAEQEECLDIVFQMFGKPEGRVVATGSAAVARTRYDSRGRRVGAVAASAVDQMIAQAMSPPTEPQSGPLKALKYLSTACGLSSEVFDPAHKCVTVKQYLAEIDTALKGANSLFKHTDLSECITGVVMVKIWGGVTVLMRSWCQPEDKEIGLAQLEEGVGYALTRPGLMTFPMWWHALHCAAIVLAHFGRSDTYMRLRATFNKNTFPGTEMPPFEAYSPDAICPQFGGSCSKLAYWLQVRGKICSDPEWKPKFSGQSNEAMENAAYEAALAPQNTCGPHTKENDVDDDGLKRHTRGAINNASGPADPLQPEEPSNERALRAVLEAGLSEIAQMSELGGLDPLGTDLDLAPLGVEFDVSDAEHVPANGSLASGSVVTVKLQDVEGSANSTEVPAASTAKEAVGVAGGGELRRDPSFGITGHAEASALAGGVGTSSSSSSALNSLLEVAEPMSRQSSLDLNVIMQMVTSDEELKKNKGGQDAMDKALAFGEGPAKELFGVELSTI